eukprot:gnl/MRDRNA2_/MRDRNA2_106014_c0_seq1.p2 gnl/MRDRNA2_/MRDRNA2_106014_c0~~gnl/MRDRNA2_/MRDRNA2_106014_c0_seq1.p2  ORF type:complete len:242 (-),score=38.82 gnl/MRDRNA2_/MRDRNA2_106014_c0_seq1:8-733(-)
MVLVWIDHITNYLDRQVIIFHSDKSYHPVVKGEQYRGKPLALEPGFDEDVDWFVIPWIGYGEMIIDIELPIKVVVGPHGANHSKDWLQFYNFQETALMSHWREMGTRTHWWDPGSHRHVHLSLTFAEIDGINSGEDIELVHLHFKGEFDVLTLRPPEVDNSDGSACTKLSSESTTLPDSKRSSVVQTFSMDDDFGESDNEQADHREGSNNGHRRLGDGSRRPSIEKVYDKSNRWETHNLLI